MNRLNKIRYTPSEGRIVSEGLDTHGLAGSQQDDGGVSRLDELGVVLGGLTGTTVNLLLDFSKLEKKVKLEQVVNKGEWGGTIVNWTVKSDLLIKVNIV